MEKQFTTLVVLEEGNKGFTEGPDGACCTSTLMIVI
jgi:hypothetical protein